MDYKTIFIVDPVKPERLQLARFIMQENFTIMGFTHLVNCFKQKNLRGQLIIYVIRPGKTDLKGLSKVNGRDKQTNFIVVSRPEAPDVNLTELKDMGFQSIFRANSNEKVREITYELLAPDGLVPRTETPHPIPLP